MRTNSRIACLICCFIECGMVIARSATNNTAALVPLPPMPPAAKSPIPYFRRLLAMNPAQLDQELSDKPGPLRTTLRAKLQEYGAMTPEERDLRLRATELRWYLHPLMLASPTNRVAQLAAVPDEYRSLVEERLKNWDMLARDVQNEILDNEWTIHYFLQLQSAPTARPGNALGSIPQEQRERLAGQLDSWLALPPEKRQQMCDRFQQFFDLPAREKEKTLNALSETERRDMERTLQAFAKLPPGQRRLCLTSFRKFASMTIEERAQFLKNAERWKEMSPSDRETWRTLVTKLPPLPPGFGEPPLPPRIQNRNPGAAPRMPPVTVALTNVPP